MWCPSVTLSVWANAWLAGAAAPDDVLDALSLWASSHSVSASDSVTARYTGLPWPDMDRTGTMTLLQTVRDAAGPCRGAEPPLRIALPVSGDVRGLPAGTRFERDALAAGEAILVADERQSAIGLVPERIGDDPQLLWTVHSLPGAPAAEQHDLGEAELALQSAVRTAADNLASATVGYGGTDVADPRGQVQQVLEATRRHRAPDTAPTRALRVLENAAHVHAILTVSSGLVADDVLLPLDRLVRSARIAAVGAILHSAWRG